MESPKELQQMIADALKVEREKVKKLEGWLYYVWNGGYPIDDIDVEIDSCIKAMEEK